MVKYVSHYIGRLGNEAIFYGKTIIIKHEEDAKSLESRLHELIKYEDENYVIFGIFSASLKASVIAQIFIQKAKDLMKKQKSIGRIWTLEINGRAKGCGIIAADDKLWIWRDVAVNKGSG